MKNVVNNKKKKEKKEHGAEKIVDLKGRIGFTSRYD